MQDSKSSFSRYIIPALPGFLFGFSVVLISLVIHINPSHYPPFNPFESNQSLLSFIVISFLISSSLFIIPLVWEQRRFFYLAFSLSLALQIALLVFCAVFIHQDFYTMVFQLFLTYPLIFFFRYEIIYKGIQESIQIRRMFSISVIFLVLWFLWLMMMGYAISTRQEPRWTESIIYNIYNAVLVFMLFLNVLKFRMKMYRRVYITDRSIRIDSYDFTEFLGSINLKIINAFLLNHNKNITCALLVPYLSNTANGDLSITADCEACISRGNKVTQCPRYKTIYNRILDIKKLFESLEIGTVIYPKNKMKILQEGWKLRFFDDIQVFDKA